MGKLGAGDLSDRVTLLTAGPSASDGRGGNVASGVETEVSVWAHVRALSGRELLTMGQTNNPAAYEVTTRFRQGVGVGQRLRWQGAAYNIQRAVADPRHEFLTLTCFNGGK